MTNTIVVDTQHGSLILERAAIQGGMKLADGRTLLLLSGRQIRTTTPIADIWPGVDLPAAPAVPRGPRDDQADAAVAAAVVQRKERDAEAELVRARQERAALALEEGRSAAREAQAALMERAAKEAAAATAPVAPAPQPRPKTVKAAKAKRAPAKRAARKGSK